MRAAMLAAALLLPAASLAAQDTTRAQDRITIVGRYQPGTRPGLVVVPGPGADSVRAILRRDLDYSDRFEVVVLPEGGAGGSGASGRSGAESGATSGLNYGLYRSFGATFALEVLPQGSGTGIRLHDLATSRLLNQRIVSLPLPTDPEFRFAVHRVADEVVGWVTGTPGIAATRFALVSGPRVYRIDSDGHGMMPVSPAGQTALSPVWSPDGQRLAYFRLDQGRGPLVVTTLSSGASATVPGTQTGLNITPAFAPDGRTLAYAHSDENGTNIVTANVLEQCCVQRLTVGRFADNLSPTYSPDGRRMAFVSTRAGPAQIYLMGADGTDPELLVPFDFGATGSSNAPEWSPDGAAVVFHREVSGSPQIFTMDVASRRLKQLTSSGRNEDPTWAPDGRHVAFVSDRSGRRQIWIIDTETSRVRQLSTPGAARLPSWSRRLR
jgi:TolB protein